jgi:predicted lactoylglutathione lyase
VKNLKKTAEFYEAIGFEIRKRETTHVTAYSNWFWMELVATGKEAEMDKDRKGTGAFFYLSVDDVDAWHKELKARGLKPASAPQDTPFGNREFGLRDPDGYNLVFFKRK